MSKPQLLFYTSSFRRPGGDQKLWRDLCEFPSFGEAFKATAVLRKNELNRGYARQLAHFGIDSRFYQVPAKRLLDAVLNPLIPIPDEVYERLLVKHRFRWISKLKPDLVWFNLGGYSAIVYFLAAAKECVRLGIPYWINLQHGLENFFFYDDRQRDVWSAAFQEAARVMFISDRNRIALERALGEKLENAWSGTNAITQKTIHEAADLATRSMVRTEGRARMVNVSRFEPAYKGQHLLLEVLADASWKDRDWQLEFVGGGNCEASIRQAARYFGHSDDRVKTVGFKEAPLSAVTEADLFVMPSLSEGTPFALVEALACARPAVGTPVGGIPELIQENRTGWLARSTEIGDIASAMERAWENRGCWPEVGQNGQQLVSSTYNQDHFFPKLIEELLRDARSAESNHCG